MVEMSYEDIWSKLVHSFKVNDERFPIYIIQFKKNESQWLERLRQELLGRNRLVAFALLPYLDEEEKINVFDILVHSSSFTHGSTEFFHNLILDLSREWVMQHIEKYANAILESGEEDEYRRILELYLKIDRTLAVNLAKWALRNNDIAIQEVGDEFLDILN